MRMRKILSLCCAAAMLGGLFGGFPSVTADAVAVKDGCEKMITVSAPNTPTGCAAPLAAFDISVAPFKSGGPFTATGYYNFHSEGVMQKDGYTSGSANVFGTPVSDTAGQWKSFTASFSTASSLAFKGIDLWYMAGSLSLCGLVIKNAAGQVVYSMDADEALMPIDTTALARRGIWYFYTYSSHPDFRITVTAPEAPLDLVRGSNYLLADNVLYGIPFGTDVATVISNLTRSDRITAWRNGSKLSGTAIVNPDTTFIYNKGKADSVTFSVSAMVGDVNGDGKLDIRDLRLIKETTFGDAVNANQFAADINGDMDITAADTDLSRNAITGQILYAAQSTGVDNLLNLTNPVGRLHKDNNMMLLEHSAANFTITGRLQGNVTATVWAERSSSIEDPVGLFVEVDGAVRFVSVPVVCHYTNITLAENLSAGKHTIRVYKASDAANNIICVSALRYSGLLSKTPTATRTIEFLGDSITAGADVFALGSSQRNQYGAITSYYSYAKMTADALGAAHYSVANSGWRLCYSINPQYTIRSVYPYQSMRSGYEGGEYGFALDPDVVVINLGTNDRYTADYSAYTKDVKELLALVRDKNPNATIIWAYGAMDTAHDSNQWIKTAVENFAATDGNTYYVPLPLNNSGANQHPNQAGQQACANTLVNTIKAIKGW